MSFLTGFSRDALQANGLVNPPELLSLLVVGAARDGLLNDTRFFTTVDTARQSFGGKTVVRLNPSPTSSTASLPDTFFPDDLSLTIDFPDVYHCPSGSSYGVIFPALANLLGSGTFPLSVTFDALGVDPSATPAPGSIFVEAKALYSLGEKQIIPAASGGVPRGNLLIPLACCISEAESLPIAAYRVGASWLPLSQPQVSFSLPGLASGSNITLTCPMQGDNTTRDIYTTPSVTLDQTGVTIDPGVVGLPYIRKTYAYSVYGSWSLMFSAINNDCLSGFIPFNLTKVTNTANLYLPPGPPTVNVTYTASYLGAGTTSVDLTTASGWATVASTESIPGDDFGFIIPSGLTGQALAADPSNAALFLDAIAYTAGNLSEGAVQVPTDPIVVLPWSLALPPSGYAYDPTNDINAATGLVQAIGPQRARNVLIIWGFGYYNELPVYQNTPVALPAAYAAITAVLRESLSTTGDNPLRPHIYSLLQAGPPYFSQPSYTEPPSGIIANAAPGTKALIEMQQAGLNTITKGIGPFWTIHGPITLLDGSPFSARLVVLLLKYQVQSSLNQYLGQPNTTDIRVKIQGTLDSIASQFTSSNTAISSYVSTLSLDVLTQPDLNHKIDTVAIAGSLGIYSELRKISFQITVQR